MSFSVSFIVVAIVGRQFGTLMVVATWELWEVKIEAAALVQRGR